MGRAPFPSCGASPRRRPLATAAALLALCGVLLFGTGPAAASSPLLSWSQLVGLPVVDIQVRAPSDVQLEAVERWVGIDLGSRLTLEALRSAVERLELVDRFRSVVIRGRPAETGEGVVLEVLLEPRLRLGEVDLVVSGGVDRGWLRTVLAVTPGAAVDERQLPELQQKLRSALERRGWRAPAIGLALEPVGDAGRARLIVRVEPGPPTRLARVRLEGWLPLPAWKLDVGLDEGEVLELDPVDEALTRLEARLRELGHLDAIMAPPEVVPRASPEEAPEADLLLEVDAGPVTEVRIEGNQRVSRARLAEDAEVLQELGTGPAALTEAKERILARYERLGYDRARVEIAGRTSDDGRRRQVLFQVWEGAPTTVRAIRFDGIEGIAEEVLRAQISETVDRFLAPAMGRPGVDPSILDEMLRGDVDEGPRRRPSTAAPDPTEVYVARAYRAGTEAIADLYRSQGYQTVEVDAPRIDRVGPGWIDVVYPIREGVRWTVGSVAFSGHEGIEGADLLTAVGLAAASADRVPLAFDGVEDGRRALRQLYRDRGYLFATVREELRAVPERGSLGGRFFSPRTDMAAICAAASAADEEVCDVEVAYRIEEGPLVRTRDIIVRGLRDTRTSVVEGEIILRPGEILSDADMRRTRDNLVRLGVFDRVAVHPVGEERAAPTKDVVVELRERDNLSLNLGVGASTEEGLRVFGAFADRNFLGTALRLQANAKVNLWFEPLLGIYAEAVQEDIRPFYRRFSVLGRDSILLAEFEVAAGISYPRIFLLPPGFSFGLDVIFLRDYDPAFAEENLRTTLIANYEGFKPKILGKERPLALQLRVNFENTNLDCNSEIEGREDLCSSGVEQGNLGDRTEGRNTYVSAGPRISWDFRDDSLDPSKGAYLELDGEIAGGLDDNSPDYARLEGRVDVYAPAAPRVTFFASLRGGQIFPLSSDAEIPLNRRFFAGGRSTIRGYPEKTLLPQDTPLGPNGNPQSDISAGGVVYVAFKTELRFELVSPVSLAGFFDIGDLWRLADGGGVCGSSGVAFVTECTLADGRVISRPLAKGGGFGLRVATPIGPLAVDMGFPIDRRDPAVEDWTLHFSVGAF